MKSSERLHAAIGIINDYIQEYEKHYELGTSSREWQQNKRDNQFKIIAGLEVLSAVTGCEYHWTRRELESGATSDAVCRIVDGIEVFE